MPFQAALFYGKLAGNPVSKNYDSLENLSMVKRKNFNSLVLCAFALFYITSCSKSGGGDNGGGVITPDKCAGKAITISTTCDAKQEFPERVESKGI